MPRPQKCRRICFTPQYDSFYPENSQTNDTITLTLDEYEVIRLVDLEKKTHEQCSAQMDVSRTTVTEIYESARYKLAQCIVNGKRLIISGGNYRICEGREYPRCGQCMCHMATAEHSFPVLGKRSGRRPGKPESDRAFAAAFGDWLFCPFSPEDGKYHPDADRD